MNSEETETTQTSLTEERLRLEREALAVERERLVAARVHAEAEARLAKPTPPVLIVTSVSLLALLCFAGGLLTGIIVTENRQQQQREERLARALSQIDSIAGELRGTNAPMVSAGDTNQPAGAHRNVSVVVIQ